MTLTDDEKSTLVTMFKAGESNTLATAVIVRSRQHNRPSIEVYKEYKETYEAVENYWFEWGRK